MTKKNFLKLIIPMIALFFVLAGIIYINFQQSKFKMEEGFNLKYINLRLNSSLDYVISKQEAIKDFYYGIEELKEDKVTLKALEGRIYTPIILNGEKDSKELKLYDGNVVYNNKVYGGKAVQVITKLIENEIASSAFIGNYISYSTNVEFKINELQRSFNYYYIDYLGAKGKRSEVAEFFKDGKFSMVDKEKVKGLKKTYPSFDILLSYSSYDNKRNIQTIDIYGDTIMAFTINGKRYYVESDKNIYDFINRKLPKYELGELGDLYKATAVKDKETGLDLMPNINWLNQVLTQNVMTDTTTSPSKTKRVVVYTINGKNEELTVLGDKILFRGKEYVVNNVGKGYEVNFLASKDDKSDNSKINKSGEQNIELKEGEMVVVANGLLYKYIKDEKFIKEINTMFDKVNELNENRDKQNYGFSNMFDVVRRKNGVNETLNFSNITVGKDGKYLTNDIKRVNYEGVYNKILNDYILKIQDLKSLKGLVNRVEVFSDNFTMYSILSDDKTTELVNALSKVKLEVTNVKPKSSLTVSLEVSNGDKGLVLSVYDEKVYVICDFNNKGDSDKAFIINNNKELIKFINAITPKQNLFKPTLPINKGQEVTVKYDGKIVDCNNKKDSLQKIIWNNLYLFLDKDKALMDIGDKEVLITFEYKDKLNTVKINKSGVYQNDILIYSGQYYINLIYNKLIMELEL